MLKKPNQSLSRNSFLTLADQIPTKIADRLEEPLKSKVINNTEILKEGKSFFDVHAHSFTIDHIPKDFIKILNWVSNRDKAKFLQWVDKKFGILMGLDDPKKVMNNLVNTYDKSFVQKGIKPELFIVNLAMDMERGISGAPTFNYKTQIEQLLEFRNSLSPIMGTARSYDYRSTVLPFLAIDPNNAEAYEYFLSGFVKNYNPLSIKGLNNSAPFVGIKLYPSLGYSPEDPVLLDIYSICEKKSIPITTHCGGIRTRTNQKNVEIGFRRFHSGGFSDEKKVVTVHSKKNFKNIFLDPLHWEKVLKRHPKLKLNLAHFGDNSEWKKFRKNTKDATSFVFKCLKLIEQFDNVFADISYSYFDEYNRKIISGMMQMNKYKNRILHGSDFFLTEIEKFTTAKFIAELEKDFTLDKTGYHLLTAINPYNFLFKDAD